MKKFFGLFLIVVLTITSLFSCAIPATLIVYNTLYYNTIAVYVDGVEKAEIDPGYNDTILVSSGYHDLEAITIYPDYGYYTTAYGNFESGETYYWYIYGNGSLSISPQNKFVE